MDRTTTSKSSRLRERQVRDRFDINGNGFDVTCTIGRVEFGAGDEHPHVVAMKLIGEHTKTGAEGSFAFPTEGGDIAHVHIEIERTDPEHQTAA